MAPEKACEIMHPKREMWVRMIRALRLAEYARKPEFGNLKELMDIFYREAYTVWQGEVERNRLKADAEQTFALVKAATGYVCTFFICEYALVRSGRDVGCI